MGEERNEEDGYPHPATYYGQQDDCGLSNPLSATLGILGIGLLSWSSIELTQRKQ